MDAARRGRSGAQRGGFGSFGCGAKLGTPNGTLLSRNMDQNLRSPGGLILTHTRFAPKRRTPGQVGWISDGKFKLHAATWPC